MTTRPQTSELRDDGYMLIGAIVLVFLVLLSLSVAAPRIAKDLQREKELESAHRAQQYVRAIRVFYRKNGNHYPNSIDQLVKTNNQRFLRQKYLDPLTGKDDWRIIHVGENKTTVKGFFQQDLPGIAGTGIGSAIGGGSTTGSTTGTSAFNNSGSGGLGSTGGSGIGGSSLGGSGLGGSGTGSTSTTGGTASNSSGIASQNATSFTGGGGAPIMGVGSSKSGEAILAVNQETTYDMWEFLYDPRIEQLYAKASLIGGISSGSAASGIGGSNGIGSGIPAPPAGFNPGGTTQPTTPTPPTTPP